MLVCYNDGKEKHQSFEVWDNHEAFENMERGYGRNKKEALEDYLNNVEGVINGLTEHFNEIEDATEEELTMSNRDGEVLEVSNERNIT